MAKISKMDCFQLKADFLPITTLRLIRHDMDSLQSQLENITLKAPQYFANAPIIVDFTALNDTTEQMDVKQICNLLRQYQMQPIAARGLPDQKTLPNLAETAQKSAPAKEKPKDSLKENTKIITKPVRAGTQVYAKDCDLIVLSSVNAGAEVIADGNIHVYGPLRGRALAGANGNTDARIFCKQLEAELVAVAGHYLVKEQIKGQATDGLVQIFLINNELAIEVL
jgi:septum site-determining protein MinC